MSKQENKSTGDNFDMSRSDFRGATINIKSNIYETPSSSRQHPVDHKTRSDYNLGNIETLLVRGFSENELRRLRFDLPGFRPMYDDLSDKASKAEIVTKLIDYAEQNLKMDTLLEWARTNNQSRYELHQPYRNTHTNNH